jgi:uncharacterized membrane protein
MIDNTHPRLTTPAIALLAGTAIACAVGIREGWGTALGSDAIAVCWAAGLYLLGRAGSDTGSVLGGREDERQQLVGLQAARLSLAVVTAAIVLTSVIAAAAGEAIWPFQVLLVVIGISYFAGLRAFGLDTDQPDGAGYSRLGFRRDGAR